MAIDYTYVNPPFSSADIDAVLAKRDLFQASYYSQNNLEQC